MHLCFNNWGLAKRSLHFVWQRITRGWSDDETWNLDHAMCTWLLPRLRRFRELGTGSYPGRLETCEEWEAILDHIIWAVEQHSMDDWHLHLPEEERPKVQEGLELLGKWLPALWW